MLILNKENILDYVKNKTNILGDDVQTVSEIGDGSLEDDGDGFVNFIFKIKCKNKSFIVKQARPYFKFKDDYILPVNRNKLEYETMKIRKSIVPEYVPNIYFIDTDNNAFIMEDVSYLKILRFQLNNLNIFKNFPKQCAEYLAKSSFYTSEYYLDTDIFRCLMSTFENSQMRKVMENVAFIKGYFELDYSDSDNELINMSNQIWSDEKVVLECYKLRDIFMKKTECLIHGDLHTSNIFVDHNQMKIIDMEYTFMGPSSYDIGYLLANFISQYSAASFKEHESHDLNNFKSYILSSMKAIFEYYIIFFNSYFDKDAKYEYKNIKGYKEYIKLEFLHEMLGFASTANINRITSLAPFPDFDIINDTKLKNKARRLSLIISKHILINRNNYNNMDCVIDEIIKIENRMLKEELYGNEKF